MGDLIMALGFLAVTCVVAWIAWRAGHDAAKKEANFTIATLRKSVRQAHADTAAANERCALIRREAVRRGAKPIPAPNWIVEQDAS